MPRSFSLPDPKKPSPAGQPCRKCGLPMWLDTVEPSNKPGHDLRTFECSGCKMRVVIEVAITD